MTNPVGSPGIRDHVKEPDWSATVARMIGKGSPADPVKAPGYLNTNYCATCTGVILSYPEELNKTDSSITIQWKTSLNGIYDAPADAVVYCGTKATALTQCGSDSTIGTTHSVTLSGLIASKAYYYQIQSTGTTGAPENKIAAKWDPNFLPFFRTNACPPSKCGGGGTTTSTFAYVLNEASGSVSVVDVDKGAIQTTIFLTGAPINSGDVVASPDGKTVYVSGSGYLFVIDTATNTIKNTIPEFGVQAWLTISSDGQYLFAETWPNTLLTILTADFSIVKSTTLPQCAGSGCSHLIASGDGSNIYVVAGGYGSTALMIDKASAINPAVSTVITPLSIPNNSGASDVASGPDGRAWIPGFYTYDGFTMVQPSGATSSVAGMHGAFSVAVSKDGSTVYAPQFINYAMQISALDTATMKVTATAPGSFSGYLWGTAVTADGSKVLVSAQCGDPSCPDLLYIVDTATLEVLSSVPVGTRANRIAVATVTTGTPAGPPPTLIYSANGSANNVSVIDSATDTITATIAVGTNPLAVAPSPDAKMVYVVNGDNTVSVITRATQTITATITLPDPIGTSAPGLISAVVGPGNNVLYVANHDAMKIYVINTSNNTITTTITVGQVVGGSYISGPLDLAITPDGATLYAVIDTAQGVSGIADGFIAVIQTVSNSVVSKITLPLMYGSVHVGGQHIAMNPLGGYAYVAANGTIQFIDTVANSVITSSISAYDTTGSGMCYQYNQIGVMPDGSAVALSCWNSITLFDTSTLQTTGNSAGNIPDVIGSIAFNADGTKAYLPAASSGSTNVNVMDMTTHASAGTVTMPATSMMVASSPAVLSVTGGTPISLLAPDLTVTSISATSPVNLSATNNITITDTVANIGGYKSGTFTIGYYLSPTNVFNPATAIGIGGRIVGGPLSAGGTSTASTSLTVSSTSVPTGDYYVIAFADSGLGIAEGNEDNNKMVSAGTVHLIQADLVETAVSSPAIGTTVLPGATISVTDTVKNQGSSTATSFRVYYFLVPSNGVGRQNSLGSRLISSLAAGATSTATVSVTVPTGAYGGKFYLQAIADFTNTVSESNESNNSFTNNSGIITIATDLTMTAVSTTATTVTRPANISITYTVKNPGTSASGGFYVGFYLSTDNAITTADTYIGSAYLSTGLAAGASSTGTVSMPVGVSIPAGTYYVGAYADYSGLVTESNETNNGLATAGTITVVLPPPDLIMSAVNTTATTVTRPGNITITYTVRNQGAGPASAFYVGFYLSTDNVITTADKYLGSFNLVAGLAAGATSSGSITLPVPTSIPAGTYYVGAYADYSGVVTESSETNNGLAKTSATLLVK